MWGGAMMEKLIFVYTVLFYRNAEVSMAHEWEGERGGDSKNKRKKRC